MGFPHTSSKFEYVHIVLSHNTKFKDHIDWKNDHWTWYDICIVFSAYLTIHSVKYRLSIIMNTGYTVGAELGKAVKEDPIFVLNL